MNHLQADGSHEISNFIGSAEEIPSFQNNYLLDVIGGALRQKSGGQLAAKMSELSGLKPTH